MSFGTLNTDQSQRFICCLFMDGNKTKSEMTMTRQEAAKANRARVQRHIKTGCSLSEWVKIRKEINQ